MKVFISWSGELSRSVAELLKDWLKCVLQATEPWISTEDIEKGSIWFTEIGSQIRETGMGVICLTQENLNAPWILFEAGGLAKRVSQNRVCTFLIDIGDTDVKPPLANFNSTKPTKNDVFKLMQSINANLGDKQLSAEILKKTFEQFWIVFETGFKEALKSRTTVAQPQKRPTEDLIEEILQICRSTHNLVNEVRSEIDPSSADYVKRALQSIVRRPIGTVADSGAHPDLGPPEIGSAAPSLADLIQPEKSPAAPLKPFFAPSDKSPAAPRKI